MSNNDCQLLVMCTLITSFVGIDRIADAADKPVVTVLATRAKLILDDDGSKDRGGKTIAMFDDNAKLRAGAGAWVRATCAHRWACPMKFLIALKLHRSTTPERANGFELNVHNEPTLAVFARPQQASGRNRRAQHPA